MRKRETSQMKKKRLSNSIRFLLIVVGIYIFIGFFDIHLIAKAVTETGVIFLKILPILAFVFIILYLINRYLNTKKIQKHLGEKSGIRGWLYAVIAGIVLAGPPYVLYPILGDLQKREMKNSLISVILYNRNVKIQFLPAMVYYFGLSFTVVISIYMLVFSLVNGALVGVLTSPEH